METVYKSRIDWWIWAIMFFCLTVIVVTGICMPWWYTAIFGIIIIAALISIFTIKYAIEDNNLIIYQYLRPHRYPINKIKEVKYCKGILSNPALSTRRIAIKFTDRSILRSSLPLEISPINRKLFVNRLLEVNPDIKVSGAK